MMRTGEQDLREFTQELWRGQTSLIRCPYDFDKWLIKDWQAGTTVKESQGEYLAWMTWSRSEAVMQKSFAHVEDWEKMTCKASESLTSTSSGNPWGSQPNSPSLKMREQQNTGTCLHGLHEANKSLVTRKGKICRSIFGLLKWFLVCSLLVV